jgi:hypothetical protein
MVRDRGHREKQLPVDSTGRSPARRRVRPLLPLARRHSTPTRVHNFHRRAVPEPGLCLVQSKAYPTQKALDAAYLQAEDSAELTVREFAQAGAATLHDVALRKRISEQVTAACAKHK